MFMSYWISHILVDPRHDPLGALTRYFLLAPISLQPSTAASIFSFSPVLIRTCQRQQLSDGLRITCARDLNTE